MSRTDVLDELIRNLDPEDVPTEYIVMAKVTDFQGVERIVKGDELDQVLHNPELHQIQEVRVIYNVRKMRRAIIAEIDGIYDEVNRMFQMRAK